MSTWICKTGRAALVAALAFALTGCAVGLGGGGEDGVTRFSVAQGAVVVSGPRGFCVDPSASSASATPAFVLMSSCRAVTGQQTAQRPRRNALLTATVAPAPARAPEGDELTEALRQFFTTPEGRAAIARSGNPDDVLVTPPEPSGTGVVLMVVDEGPGPEQLSDTYWRGVFALNGYLVTASVIGYADRPLSPDDGKALLQAFRRAIESASPRSAGGSTATVQTENSPFGRILGLAGLRR